MTTMPSSSSLSPPSLTLYDSPTTEVLQANGSVHEEDQEMMAPPPAAAPAPVVPVIPVTTPSPSSEPSNNDTGENSTTRAVTPNNETVDLMLPSKELARLYAPTKTKTQQLAPPFNWRQNINQIRSWYTMSKESQVEEKEKWSNLSQTEKNQHKIGVPGWNKRREERVAARKTAPVASNTRASRDNRIPLEGGAERTRQQQVVAAESFPTGMAGTEEERATLAASIARKPTSKKGIKRSGATTVHDQYSHDVRMAERQLMIAAAKYAAMIQPQFLCNKETPRHRMCLVLTNEMIDYVKNGRPTIESSRNKKAKTDVTMVGISSSDELTKNQVLRDVINCMRYPSQYNTNIFMHSNERDATDRLKSYFAKQDDTVARPRTGSLSFQEAARNIPEEALDATYDSPTRAHPG